jgi:CRP/FNR family transcriptional regulator, cyclic AMP receptor protein
MQPDSVLLNCASVPVVRRLQLSAAQLDKRAIRSLSLDRLLAVQRGRSRTIRLPRGEVVYDCYGFPDREPSVYFVEQGFVKVIATSSDGKECLLDIFTIGDIIGDFGLFGQIRSETVVTMTASRLRRMSTSLLMSSLDDEGFRGEFIRYLGSRIVQQQRLITDFVTTDSEYRLAATLLHLAQKIGQQEDSLSLINVRITHEELSAMVGTTRSRIGLFLRRFVERGAVLRRRGGLLAVHVDRMTDLMGVIMADRDQRFSARPGRGEGVSPD